MREARRRSLDERQSLCQDLRKSVLNQGGKNLTVITIIVKYLWRCNHASYSTLSKFSLAYLRVRLDLFDHFKISRLGW